MKPNFVKKKRMDDRLKKIIKKTLPLGMLMAAHKAYGKVLNKFRYSWFLKDWANFKNLTLKNDDSRFSLSVKDFAPVLHEKGADQGFDRHYVYHLAWAARKVKQISPAVQFDISSSLHFCSIVSAFVPFQYYDYRATDLKLSHLAAGKADLLKLPFADNSISSLSCMHTVEHIGLGRYGDPVDPLADLKAMKELSRVLTKDGNLLFVVPVGKPIVRFNAERTYSYEQVREAFKELKLKEFSLLPDVGALVENALPELVKDQIHGCGCFWFTKE